ncbi:hypothetical protein OBV_46480 [Oscillibacter valericigenes Sjm18-20]|nr:hypothetical protein OBV_46480 [Oscillibacter valericigenes Sjm18-20]
MKFLQKLIRLTALILTLTTLLAVPALADSGPKPQLIVRVENGPEEPYYLDLLEEGDPDPKYLDYCLDWNYHEEERAALDPELLQSLRDAVPEGWDACVAQGNQGRPIYGNLTGTGGIHKFSYVGVPETYRVIVVTKSGETWVSEPLTRHALQCSAKVDWAEKTISTPPVWMEYVLQFFATCVPTLVIEGLILLLFGYKWRTSWKPFLTINLVTQGALALYYSVNIVQHGFNFWLLFLFVPSEIVIAVAEALLYRRFLTGRGKARAVVYGLTANAASAILGLFLAGPVWQFVVSNS